MPLKEKFNVTHSSPRSERHSTPCGATVGSTSVSQGAESSEGRPRPHPLLGFLQESQARTRQPV